MSRPVQRGRMNWEVVVRVRWLPLVVVLLCTVAIIWILVAPQNWTSPLILVGAAVALAILERENPR